MSFEKELQIFFNLLEPIYFYITKGHNSKFCVKWQLEMDSGLMLSSCIPYQGQQGPKVLWFTLKKMQRTAV